MTQQRLILEEHIAHNDEVFALNGLLFNEHLLFDLGKHGRPKYALVCIRIDDSGIQARVSCKQGGFTVGFFLYFVDQRRIGKVIADAQSA